MLPWILLGALVACEGSVVLTQTYPAAPYVCRTGNITLRCQYDGVEGVLSVVWAIGDQTTANASTIPGHTALPHTTTYREVGVDSYTNLAAGYHCESTLSNGTQILSNQYYPQNESAEVTLSNLTLASRTATTLSVTWSGGYPKCYSFTVSHSTQDGSINITQAADNDTSHTLTSLQPGTTYRIEVEAVRKGDGADGQSVKVMGNYTTEGEDTTDVVPSKTIIPTTTLPPRPSASSETVDISGALIGGVIGGSLVLSLVSISCSSVAVLILVLVCRRPTVPVMKSSVKADLDGEEPPTREEEEEEREKMQANPAYLPIEMCYNSQERQLYLNVMMAPPDTDVAEDHTKMQANPSYQSIEMMSY